MGYKFNIQAWYQR